MYIGILWLKQHEPAWTMDGPLASQLFLNELSLCCVPNEKSIIPHRTSKAEYALLNQASRFCFVSVLAELEVWNLTGGWVFKVPTRFDRSSDAYIALFRFTVVLKPYAQRDTKRCFETKRVGVFLRFETRMRTFRCFVLPLFSSLRMSETIRQEYDTTFIESFARTRLLVSVSSSDWTVKKALAVSDFASRWDQIT